MTVTVQWLPRLEQSQPLKIGGLFYGYGGLDIAVQDVIPNTELAWYAEFDKGASKIGAHHHPDVPNHGDVTQIDWAAVEPVDILTGGFPCTDVSSAGKKEGVNNGQFSGLWREMARAVRYLRPHLVLVENVRDLLARGLDIVLGDLAAIGYDARWTCLPACDVGAPFRRERLFLLATPAAPAGADSGRRQRIPQPDRHPKQDAPLWQGRLRHDTDRLAMGEVGSLDRWGSVLGRSAPDPLGRGVNGQPRLDPRFVEWLMGLAAGWVTDVPGITRNEALKALGNGVVPQQAAAALRVLLAP